MTKGILTTHWKMRSFVSLLRSEDWRAPRFTIPYAFLKPTPVISFMSLWRIWISCASIFILQVHKLKMNILTSYFTDLKGVHIGVDIHIALDDFINWKIIDNLLTLWGRDKMAAILLPTFSKAFAWIKTISFWFKFHWNVFLGVQLAIIYHCFI